MFGAPTTDKNYITNRENSGMKRMNARYAGQCGECGQRFPAGASIDYDRNAPKGLKAFHADCDNAATGENRIMEITTASGTFYQREGGRCEDAPCCGCCTF